MLAANLYDAEDDVHTSQESSQRRWYVLDKSVDIGPVMPYDSGLNR